jgi:DNA-binding IclR family transcriptional regulator
VLLAFLPRQVTGARLRLEVERAIESGLSWPDLDLSVGSVEKVIETVRRDGFATIDGRFVPGLRAVAAPITNWQGEAEAAVTLISTSDQILSAQNQAVRALMEFVNRLSSQKRWREREGEGD